MAIVAPRLPSYQAPNDPMAGLYELFRNPNMGEVNTSAAEAALGGGFSGSQFGGNNVLRMRDSERMAREATLQQLLNPYLERASREGLAREEMAGRERLTEKQNQFELGKIGAQTQAQRELAQMEQEGALERLGVETASRTALEQLQQGGEAARQRESIGAQQENLQQQIAADAARQAIEQSGLKSRLDSEGQQRLQLALIAGDQQAASDLLREAGANTRQREQITGQLQIATLNARNELLGRILPYAMQQESRGSEGYGDGRVAPAGTNDISTGPKDYQRPLNQASGRNGNILSRVDQILQRYGLS